MRVKITNKQNEFIEYIKVKEIPQIGHKIVDESLDAKCKVIDVEHILKNGEIKEVILVVDVV